MRRCATRRSRRLSTVAAVLLSSCSVSSTRIDGAIPDSHELVEGKTDYRAALDLLGPPTRIGAVGDGFAFFYGTLEIRESQLRLAYRAGQFAASEGNSTYTSCLLHFGNDGRLRAVRRSRGHVDLGQGGVAGSATEVDPFYGARGYSPPPPQLLWGLHSLRPLGLTLNASGNIEYGTDGLELHFTPRAQGQHAMELPSR